MKTLFHPPSTGSILGTPTTSNASTSAAEESISYVLQSIVKLINYFIAAFHDDGEENTFGVLKKGIYIPMSDFRFDLMLEVYVNRHQVQVTL